MEEIILKQKNAAKPMTGKRFVLGVAGIVTNLAIAQIAVNLAITLTGTGLINIAFYVYAVWLLVRFMRRTVASYIYTLKPGVLYLEKKLGDSTMSLVEIPLSRVISMRPAYRAERLRASYSQVTVIDPQAGPTLRVRAAFAASLLSAGLARRLAGARAQEQIGDVIVFIENGESRACVFRPDKKMRAELARQLGDVYGFDERTTQKKKHSLWLRALERAFPALYPYVDPLLPEEETRMNAEKKAAKQAAKEEKKQARKAARAAKKQKKKASEAEAAEESVQEAEQEAEQETAQETAQESAAETAQEAAPETVTETVTETVNESVNESAPESVQESANDSAEESAEESEEEIQAEAVQKTDKETAQNGRAGEKRRRRVGQE